MVNCFTDFAIGDHVCFTKQFTMSDFEAFSVLSGDRNRLHHDQGHAAGTEFGKPVVPLHLAIAPMSAMAGMGFPGDPSLYLWHEVKAVSPVYYDVPVTYSCRLTDINLSHQVLTLSVLVFSGNQVLIEAKMGVKARDSRWEQQDSLDIIRADRRRTALVTGASGTIGGAVARRLSDEGWNLILPVREGSEGKLPRSLQGNTDIRTVDLREGEAVSDFCTTLKDSTVIDAVIHAASPPVEASVTELAAVNYSAFDAIVDTVLPGMMGAQEGHIVLIGSSAVRHRQEWRDYVAAKYMAQSVVNRLGNLERFGISGSTIAPGFVLSDFSRKYRSEETDVLMPEQVAEAVLDVMESARPVYLELEASGRRTGSFRPGSGGDLSVVNTPSAVAAPAPSPAREPDPTDSRSRIEVVFRRSLGLDDAVAVNGLVIGDVPVWDSLRHIQLMMDLEAALDIRFSSNEIAQTTTYGGLSQLCVEKLQSN